VPSFNPLVLLFLKYELNVFDNVLVDHLEMAVNYLFYIFDAPLKDVYIFNDLLLCDVVHVYILQEMNSAEASRVRIQYVFRQPIMQVEAVE
jgi:hypothetical protein